MKKLIAIVSLLSAISFMQQARALEWVYAGQAPWVYNNEDSTWYYMQAFQGGVWFFGAQTFEIVPPQGFAPGNIAGRRVTVETPGELISISFSADGTYVETSNGETFSGTYSYAKTGNNTATLVLLENSQSGNIAAVTLTFDSTGSGSLEGRSTEVSQTNPLSALFELN